MIRRSVAVAVALLWVGGTAMAEQSRPLFTKENKFPDFHRAELGTFFQYNEVGDENESLGLGDVNQFVVEPFVRYRATENMTLQASVPYVNVDPDFGDGADGVGDVSIGAEWLAYEHICTFPYIIPHVTAILDTGDEVDGTGLGESRVKAGITLGTMRWDDWTFNGDVSYTFFEDAENIFAGAVSVIWDLSEQFSWLVEGVVTDEEEEGTSDSPGFVQGGFSYQPTERFQFTAYGGGGKNQGVDVSASLKLSYDL